MDRILKLQAVLDKEKATACIVNAGPDLFYLIGHCLSAGKLLVEKNRASLFVDGRYFESCKTLPFPVFLTKNFGKTSPFSEAFSELKGTVLFDSVHTSFAEYQDLLSFIPPGVTLAPFAKPIEKIREVKEGKEIDLLKEAANLAEAGMKKGWESLREGIEEQEVAAQIEVFWRLNGGQKPAFDSIVAFQENGSFPHYRAGGRKLKRGECVLLDIGVMKNHYASDMTRVVAFGSPDPLWKEIYKIVYEAYQAALKNCYSGARAGSLDAAAREVITKAGYGEFFTHSLGHGVGLDVHELPVLRKESETLLQPGMVVTIEPGIYLPHRGGIRLENTVVVGEGDPDILTGDLPEEIPVL